MLRVWHVSWGRLTIEVASGDVPLPPTFVERPFEIKTETSERKDISRPNWFQTGVPQNTFYKFSRILAFHLSYLG